MVTYSVAMVTKSVAMAIGLITMVILEVTKAALRFSMGCTTASNDRNGHLPSNTRTNLSRVFFF